MILPFLNGSFDSANLTTSSTIPACRGAGSSSRSSGSGSCAGRRGASTSAPRLLPSTRTPLATRSWRSARRRCSRWSSTSCSRSRFVGGGTAKLVAGYDYAGAMDKIVGSTRLSDFFLVCLCISFIISMNTATADGGRALLGISRDGMTIKWLGKLNRFNVPGNGMTRRHGRQHLFRCSSSATSSAILAASQPRATCSRTCSRSRASCCCGVTGPTGRRPIKLGGDLDADRRAARGLVPDPHDRRLRLVPGRRRRLRRHQGEDDRRRACS